MTTQQIVSKLIREYHAIKQTFAQAVTKLNLFTKTMSYSTKRNSCRFVTAQTAFNYDDNERVEVTLTTPSGVDTLATLEVSGDYGQPPIIRRVPFSGGARWVVSNVPRVSVDGTWLPTNYQFAVQTLINGSLAAKMVWE